MTVPYGAICDEFLVFSRLFLKLDLTPGKEALLQFFDRLRREIPRLRHLRRRDENSFVLEEPDEFDSRRWVRLDASSIRTGYANPPSLVAVRSFGQLVWQHAPFFLTLSELDYDYLEVTYCFDLEYQGNHDELVAETFMADHPLASLLFSGRVRHIIDCQPFFGVALNDDCDLQAFVEIKGRSSTYEVRTGQYDPQPLSVYLTIRNYLNAEADLNLADVFEHLCDTADELAGEKVVPLVVNPLAQAIASRP